MRLAKNSDQLLKKLKRKLGKKMHIVFHTQEILKIMGGSTISVLQTLKTLKGFGHEVAIIAPKTEMDEYCGMPVFEEKKNLRIWKFYSWADVVFVKRKEPLQHIKEYKCWHVPHGASPIYTVYFASNVGQPYKWGYQEGDVDLVVFNSDWIRRETNWNDESTVLHPPVFKENYMVEQPGEYITQINLSPKKGGKLFWEIAEAIPEKKFLGVVGKGNDQIIPEPKPGNVKIVEYTSDVREIYDKTKILLMPSQGYGSQHRWSEHLWTESYGRVGVEASLSGIPVLAYPTPGIKEALGDAGIYCDMEISTWISELKRLSDSDQYEAASKQARLIGDRINPIQDIKRLESLLITRLKDGTVAKKSSRYKPFFELQEFKNIENMPNRRKEKLAVDIVVLMAGQGKRLLPLTEDRPKALLCDKKGVSIFEHTVQAANKFRWKTTIIPVIGHGYTKVWETVESLTEIGKFDCVYNPFSDQSGPLISFWLGLMQSKSDIVVFLNGDTLIKPALFENIDNWIRTKKAADFPEIGMCVSESTSFQKDDMKVKLDESNYFDQTGKEVPEGPDVMKSAGVICVRNKASKKALKEKVEEIFTTNSSMKKNFYWHNLLNESKGIFSIDLINVDADSWFEIDTLVDLKSID